jgi:hypothetical protein
LDAKGKQEGFLVRKGHAVHLARMALDLGDEPGLILGAGSKAAITLKHSLHDSSRRG